MPAAWVTSLAVNVAFLVQDVVCTIPGETDSIQKPGSEANLGIDLDLGEGQGPSTSAPGPQKDGSPTLSVAGKRSSKVGSSAPTDACD